MKNTLTRLITIVACLAIGACVGKNAPEAPAPTVEVAGPATGVPDTPATTSEAEALKKGEEAVPAVLKQVLDQVYEAGGDYRWAKPNIRLAKSASFVATFRPRSNEILVEEKALKACRSLGKDSTAMLAFLIGHELSHFYDNEGKKSGVSTNFLAFDHHHEGDLQSEINADLRGIFLCHVAGYDRIRALLPEFIERVYSNYQMKESELTNYPPKRERQAHAMLVQNRADTLFHVFQAATYLTGFGKYTEATACYDFLLQYYNGAEVFNNLGVLNAMQAMQVGGKYPDTLWYPLELDVYTRLEAARRNMLTLMEEKQRKALLVKALQQIEAALEMNPDYKAAYANRLCVKLLLGQNEEVASALQNSKSLVKGDLKKLLSAILKAQTGEDREGVEQAFQKLANSNDQQVATVAKFNAAVMSKQEIKAISQSCKIKDANNYLDGVKNRDLRSHGGFALDKEGKLLIQWQEKQHSTFYLFNRAGQRSAFQVINSPAVFIDPRLKVGLSLRQKDFPVKQVLLAANLGSFWLASPCQLLIKTVKKGKVEEWAKAYN